MYFFEAKHVVSRGLVDDVTGTTVQQKLFKHLGCYMSKFKIS